MTLKRRDLIKIAAAGGAAMAIPFERSAFTKSSASRIPASKLPKPFTLPFAYPPEWRPGSQKSEIICQNGQNYDYPSFTVEQNFGVAEILPGYKTPVFGYNGVVPGPTIRVQQGQPIIVNQKNLLHQPPAAPYQNAAMPSKYTNDPRQRSTSTHLHGSASMPHYDGYASDITMPGQWKPYFYPNSQEARTLWYHDHGVHHTSQNAYNGLAAMYILHDRHEQSLGIPSGNRYDVPLIVRDATFATDGSLVYDDNSESGVYGDVMLVNGVPWPTMTVERRKYRFRILNAAVSRSFEWSLTDGKSALPLTVIGTDAGLMPKPQVVSKLRHGMAERYEIVIDFAKYPDNTRLTMKNTNPKNNIGYDTMANVMQFRVMGDATDTSRNSLPSTLATAECMTFKEADLKKQGVKEREFKFIRKNGKWTINGETWEDVISSGYKHVQADPGEGDIEIWQLTNTSGGWFHPVHIHLVDFQVLSRNGTTSQVRAFEKGPKDVVYVGENETVRVAMRFSGPRADDHWNTPKGRYMMHCHNLVHEDHDMMMQFSVGDLDNDPIYDPIEAGAALPIRD